MNEPTTRNFKPIPFGDTVLVSVHSEVLVNFGGRTHNLHRCVVLEAKNEFAVGDVLYATDTWCSLEYGRTPDVACISPSAVLYAERPT